MERQIEKLVDRIESVHGAVGEGSWRAMGRKAFINTLERTVPKLEEMRLLLDDINYRMEGTYIGAPDLKPLMDEFDGTIAVLEQNLALEKGRSETSSEEINIHEKMDVPELYSSLEQKILTLLLRCRYFAERANVVVGSAKPAALQGKSTAKNLMELLRSKEEEIQNLKQSYSELRKKSYFGALEQESAADMEQDLNSLARKLEVHSDQLGREYAGHQRTIDSAHHSYAELKSRIDMIEEILEQYMARSAELITSLKKERDYAKKIVLGIEDETLRLRSSYTKQLLGLEEAKLKAKEEESGKYGKIISELKKESDKNAEMAGSFREMVERRERKITKLEEANEKLKERLEGKAKRKKK